MPLLFALECKYLNEWRFSFQNSQCASWQILTFIMNRLQELVKKYSEFISFPIYLWASKEVDVEVPVEESEDKEDKEVEDKEDEDEESSGMLLINQSLELYKTSCVCKDPELFWSLRKLYLCICPLAPSRL